MSGIKDQHELEEMRKRLYSRGFDVGKVERHNLTDRPVDVARNWHGAPVPHTSPEPVPPSTTLNIPPLANDNLVANEEEVVEEVHEEKRGYRRFILIGTLIFLVLGGLFATAIIFLGGNKISSDNINFTIGGPSTVGSGETMSLQVGITNQNTVAIEGATLVVTYPSGSRSATEPDKNVYEERFPVGSLGPGEVKNVPLQVSVFGKENDQKEVKATFEYRLVGSDGTFYKEADPLKFVIVSSPLILQVSAVEKVAAGQEVEVSLTAKSNASTPLKNVLISAAYPGGFTFVGAKPDPIYNQNTWLIEELNPSESKTIKIRGKIAGLTEEKFGINFSAGLAETDNRFIVASLLAEARTEFVIERPFISVDISISGDADRTVVLSPGLESNVNITIKNTLDESVYDMVAEVVPSGNVLNKDSIDAKEGFYDSNRGVIRWETANNQDFSQVQPGDERTLRFSLLPNQNQSTASFDITVNVYARRVSERSAQEQLIGTVTATAKYESAAAVSSKVRYVSGAVPPKVAQTTNYIVTLVAEAGANNITDTVVTTSLPSHVNWLNEYSGPGKVDYNPISKQLTWNVGEVTGNGRQELNFSVSILPSVSQVGIKPILVNRQDLTATDRFTGTRLSAWAGPITTELPPEAGFGENSDRVTE